MTVTFCHMGVLQNISHPQVLLICLLLMMSSQLTPVAKAPLFPVWRSGCGTGAQHHLIPHQPQRPQGGEPLRAAKLSISVFLPLHIPLNPHSILPPITSVYYLSHYAVPVRLSLGGLWGSKAAREIWA